MHRSTHAQRRQPVQVRLLWNERTMTIEATRDFDVPLPEGAEFGDDWRPHPKTPYRVISGPHREVALGNASDAPQAIVCFHAVQFADGTIDVEGRVEPPGISVDIEWKNILTSDQARVLAAIVMQAADEIDRWASK